MTSIEINLLIYEKKPFPSLLWLLDHTDISIAYDGIFSIFNIVIGGDIITPNNTIHPYYNTMNACGWIEIIMKLYRNNVDKYTTDIAANLCWASIQNKRNYWSINACWNNWTSWNSCQWYRWMDEEHINIETRRVSTECWYDLFGWV